MAGGNKMNEVKSDLAELERLQKQATRKYVSDVLSLEIRKLQSELIKLQDELVNSGAGGDSTSSNGPKSEGGGGESNKQQRYRIKLNGYGWDQSDKFVKVFVTLKNVQSVPAGNVRCDITDDSMELRVEDLDGKDYALAINKLLKPINPTASHWKQKTDMVVIFLAKVDPGATWSHMTEIEKRFEENKTNRFKTDGADGSKDPQESLMGLMRNMYESGDDDMKRMIKKAWTEGQDKQGSKTMDF